MIPNMILTYYLKRRVRIPGVRALQEFSAFDIIYERSCGLIMTVRALKYS